MTKKNTRRLEKLVDAVSQILGDDHKARKLKKAKALERFISKLEDRRAEIERELKRRRAKGKGTDEQAEKSKSLHKQIKRAKKILAEMD